MNPTIKCTCGNAKAKEVQYCDTCWAWLPVSSQQKIHQAAQNLKSAKSKSQEAITGANALLHLHRRGKI